MLRSWITLAIGVWVLLAPWLLGVSGVAVIMWSNLLAGLILILMNLWQIFGQPVSADGPGSTDGSADKNGKVGTNNSNQKDK
ncbi:MAG TPA: SPW repeat protein [Candidatus Paceibacterota bacterium]|nr:SPW repeat protein [Candidatus Paceibacterota bacterium]